MLPAKCLQSFGRCTVSSFENNAAGEGASGVVFKATVLKRSSREPEATHFRHDVRASGTKRKVHPDEEEDEGRTHFLLIGFNIHALPFIALSLILRCW